MSVENIPHPVSNPVRDAMSVAADDGIRVSSLTGFFRENDLFFYRHSVPNGTYNPAITKFRHWQEERRSNPVIIRYFRIASLRLQ
jgi:hypothetical protein